MTSLHIATSTIKDGSMKSPDRNFATALPIRAAFLAEHHVQPADTTLVQVTYEGDDYCRYATIGPSHSGDGITRAPTIEADALVTNTAGQTLFMPLADCIAAVMYSEDPGVVMVSHLGRHNLEQFGGTKCVEYLQTYHNIHPSDLTVWLSPAAGSATYPLFAFDNRSLHDVAIEQLIAAGVPADAIASSPIDSATDSDYFSHSQFLSGNQSYDGRFAVAARFD